MFARKGEGESVDKRRAGGGGLCAENAVRGAEACTDSAFRTFASPRPPPSVPSMMVQMMRCVTVTVWLLGDVLSAVGCCWVVCWVSIEWCVECCC